MISNNSWILEEGVDSNPGDAWQLEEDGTPWVLEEATDLVLNNYLRVSGAGRMSVAGFGALVLMTAWWWR